MPRWKQFDRYFAEGTWIYTAILPVGLLNYIALATGNKPAKVLGVATFYAQFRLEPVGKYLIMLCQGDCLSCERFPRKSEKAVMKNWISKKERQQPDGLFTLNNGLALAAVPLSPVMMINGETYGTLTPAKARKILADLKAKRGAAAMRVVIGKGSCGMQQ